MTIDNVRVIVLGESKPDESEFVQVTPVKPFLMGPTQRWWNAWGWDAPIELPWHSKEVYTPLSHFPLPGGARVMVARFPEADIYLDEAPVTPEHQADHDRVIDMLSAVDVAMTAVGPHPAMHRTDTVDLGFVAEGEVDLEASDGTVVTLRAGDIYVNSGAVHAWKARQSGATVFFVFLGANRKSVPGPVGP
ncbi:hypothetical protein EH165_04975 [Nakamurella antarctica]|uniref:Cupin type-2 domain-containing protein n=1 Tax=Nakamurella antarctica TaxID=1902245 RepID=A0A3G8ZK09_9ACTN|nr:cupin domain-containing protein [Nakamurella antarctica]AZI57603.1 hypothetical protein EH165_04975 [Nakamurella antarctica]